MAYTDIDKPSDYFETVLYAGNSGTQSITSLDFQPDWCWFKARNNTDTHAVFDSVRGVTKRLIPDNTTAEGTQSNGLTHFLSNGFTVADAGITNQGHNYVAWNWKAGTSVSGNTSGSGTAKAYSGSVNTDAGFSIIKYVGNGTSAHTIPHHLGAVPQWVLIKETSNASDWMGYHIGIGNTHTIKLNEPDAPVDRTDWWNDTTPTSSVVTLGDNGEINQNDTNYIMYSFSQKQGYSKFGSYTGNGNVDGTFFYTGFKPAFTIIRSTGSDQWSMFDAKRNPFNEVDNNIRANSNAAEADQANKEVDYLSNGVKLRTSSGEWNSSGTTYIYMAFAEQPFVTSTGVPATAR